MQDPIKLERYQDIICQIIPLQITRLCCKEIQPQIVNEFMKSKGLEHTEYDFSKLKLSYPLQCYINYKLQYPHCIGNAAICLPDGSSAKLIMELLAYIWDNLD